MDFKNILYEKKDGIAKITLNRPEAMNSIDSDTHLELHAALDDIAHDKAVRVAVLTATGRAFCTGADLKFAMTLQGDQQKAEDFIGQWRKTTETIANLPKPVIAAVNGIALAGQVIGSLHCFLHIIGIHNCINGFVKIFVQLGIVLAQADQRPDLLPDQVLQMAVIISFIHSAGYPDNPRSHALQGIPGGIHVGGLGIVHKLYPMNFQHTFQPVLNTLEIHVNAAVDFALGG